MIGIVGGSDGPTQVYISIRSTDIIIFVLISLAITFLLYKILKKNNTYLISNNRNNC